MYLATVAIYRFFFRNYTSINKKLYCSFAICTLPNDGPRVRKICYPIPTGYQSNNTAI